MNIRKRLLQQAPAFIQDAYLQFKEKKQQKKWEKAGRPIPVPHSIKQQAIRFYAQKYNADTLIETGTYLGDMLWAQRKYFKQLYSIELSDRLAEMARKRFAGYPHIHIIQGDSGKMLATLADVYNRQAVFWLDGHYSSGITAQGDKDCPVYEELEAIFKSGKNHILLIDDAREFTGKGDYPSLDELSAYILKTYPNSTINVDDDIIRVELRK